ncbi:MAG: phosphoribosyltransferase [Gaiellaceae bacterium]
MTKRETQAPREPLPRRFRDRAEAGRRLAERLDHYRARGDVVVLALPRGGVPVAAELAGALGVALEVFVVRKLGVPRQEELAFGAIASAGTRVVNRELVEHLRLPPELVAAVERRERRELERRERLYRGDRPPVDLTGRTAILVDDGLATGATMRAAIAAARELGAARIVVAVPTGAIESCAHVQEAAEELVCLMTPRPFFAVSLWYDRFEQLGDDEVREELERAWTRQAAGAAD